MFLLIIWAITIGITVGTFAYEIKTYHALDEHSAKLFLVDYILAGAMLLILLMQRL